ncbi:unnamed protein product [Cercopithifilaria johnstoni]|uniref:Uncharacterized protein n=1 Tax=Cercopithifilaria johnstoni TaxID=2874296 RepID=A0A8J2MA39_9BILA|nr:unnamed protein product [Cercopithifilaria johnstoni]
MSSEPLRRKRMMNCLWRCSSPLLSCFKTESKLKFFTDLSYSLRLVTPTKSIFRSHVFDPVFQVRFVSKNLITNNTLCWFQSEPHITGETKLLISEGFEKTLTREKILSTNEGVPRNSRKSKAVNDWTAQSLHLPNNELATRLGDTQLLDLSYASDTQLDADHACDP